MGNIITNLYNTTLENSIHYVRTYTNYYNVKQLNNKEHYKGKTKTIYVTTNIIRIDKYTFVIYKNIDYEFCHDKLINFAKNNSNNNMIYIYTHENLIQLMENCKPDHF